MVRRVTLHEEQAHYALLAAAATALVNLRELLAHPTLDISMEQREQIEQDAQALAECLPRKVRLTCNAETVHRAALDSLVCPF